MMSDTLLSMGLMMLYFATIFAGAWLCAQMFR